MVFCKCLLSEHHRHQNNPNLSETGTKSELNTVGGVFTK